MKRPLLLSFFALVTLALAGCRPPQTVEYVDLSRYLGLWYEVASYETSFQRGCVAATAEYSLRDDGKIRVLNTCREGDPSGPVRTAEAVATVKDTETNAKLSVKFGWFPAPYWIIDLDPTPGDAPYAWAVVSDPTRSYLWILSRTPELPPEVLDGILARLDDAGYDLDELQYTVR